MTTTDKTGRISSLIQIGLLVMSICLLLTTVSGCQKLPIPVSYEDLCGLTSEQLGTMGEEDVRQWLEGAYDRQVAQDATEGEVSITTGWTNENGVVTAYLRNGRLFHIRFQEIKNGPSLGQVVAGLGAPEVISYDVTSYGPHVVYFIGLDYPELGISLEAWGEMTSRELEEWTVTLREDLQVDWISCYSPCSSVEEVLKEVHKVSPVALQSEMNRRMPWPGFGGSVSLLEDVP